MSRHPHNAWLSGAAILSGLLLADATCNVRATNACVNVVKDCVEATAPGQPITFSGTVTNCSNKGLAALTLVDDHAGPLSCNGMPSGSITLAVGASCSYSGSYIPTVSPSTNIVTAVGTGTFNQAQATEESPRPRIRRSERDRRRPR